MKSAKVHREDEDEEDEELLSRKEAPSSNRDGKNADKANAIRSKHSVTEQRRRSKINERFQLLRDLIPHSDQKRDTASFLVEVIEYVQYLQEKVQKYEGGSYEGWSSEPTKLMPWRNTHWRVQNLAGHTQATKNGSGPGSTYPGRLDESSIPFTPAVHMDPHNALQFDPSRDYSGTVDQQPELVVPVPSRSHLPASIQGDHAITRPLQTPISDAQLTGCPVTTDQLTQHEDFTIEGGTISITNVYSQGLLDNLTQALQSSGVDLSQATISVQIDLGKRAANRGLTSGASTAKGPDSLYGQPVGHSGNDEATNVAEVGSAQKKMKI